MGNEHNSNKECEWSLLSHPVLRHSQIFQQKNVMKTEVTVLDEQDLEPWIYGMQKVKGLQNQFLLNALSYSIKSRAMCGTSCTIRITFSNYPYILMEEIINRCKIQQKFQENQIWYLLYALADCSNSCLSIQGKIGDIRPHNILFNEEGEIKIVHRYSWPDEKTNFQKSLFEKTQTFLSPEQMQLLQKHKTFNTVNLSKAESFSVGVTILCVFYLEDCSYLYNLEDYRINQVELTQKLNNLEDLQFYHSEHDIQISYSQQLINIIRRLCDLNPAERLGILELHKWMIPYQKEIVNFHPFTFMPKPKSQSSKSYKYDRSSNIGVDLSTPQRSNKIQNFKQKNLKPFSNIKKIRVNKMKTLDSPFQRDISEQTKREDYIFKSTNPKVSYNQKNNEIKKDTTSTQFLPPDSNLNKKQSTDSKNPHSAGQLFRNSPVMSNASLNKINRVSEMSHNNEHKIKEPMYVPLIDHTLSAQPAMEQHAFGMDSILEMKSKDRNSLKDHNNKTQMMQSTKKTHQNSQLKPGDNSVQKRETKNIKRIDSIKFSYNNIGQSQKHELWRERKESLPRQPLEAIRATNTQSKYMPSSSNPTLELKTQNVSDDQLLLRIEQQLHKSRTMFPS